MSDQLNNKNKRENSRVEFGIEFGDVNASKVMEAMITKKNDKKNKDKKNKD